MKFVFSLGAVYNIKLPNLFEEFHKAESIIPVNPRAEYEARIGITEHFP